LLPPDECNISMERLDRSLETHSRYAGLSETVVDAMRLLLQNYDQYKDDYESVVTGSTLGNELWKKMKRGFISYPIWTPVYRWKLYFWAAPPATEGGYKEIPGGPITGPDTDWIRQADQLDFNGTHWVLERSWIGVPDLDVDIY
jgi:hypothetical protein